MPFFEVTITSLPNPIDEGDLLEVVAEVENTGTSTGTQDIELVTASPVTLQDTQELTLNPGEDMTVTLTWQTQVGDAGLYELQVQSDDDSDFKNLTVEEGTVTPVDPTPNPTPVDVTVLNPNITVGDPICVECLVEGETGVDGPAWVGVGVGNRATPADGARNYFEGDQQYQVKGLTIPPAEYREAGTQYEKEVWAIAAPTEAELVRGVASEKKSDVPVSITHQGRLTSEITGTNAPVEEDETLEVTAKVTNDGGIRTEGEIYCWGRTTPSRASGDGADDETLWCWGGNNLRSTGGDQYHTTTPAGFSPPVDDRGVELGPGESTEVTLEWRTRAGDAGDRLVSVGAIATPRGDPRLSELESLSVHSCSPSQPVDATVVSIEPSTGTLPEAALFAVTIDGQDVGGLQRVSVPGNSTESGRYNEDDVEYDTDSWGDTSFDDIEIKRVATAGDTRFWDWRQDVIDGQVDVARKEVTVTLNDVAGEPQIQWAFQNAWAKDYCPADVGGPDSNGASECLTIAYDTMERTEL